MSFDREGLAAAIARQGRVARVVILETAGSAPREAGTAMLVWADGQSGTIGGGALEWEAARAARGALAEGRDRLDRQPLGPALAQCCGGAVTLLTEVWDAARLAGVGGVTGATVVRPGPGVTGVEPLAVARARRAQRQGNAPQPPRLVAGWVIEDVARATQPLWVWGAGHVGRAIVHTAHPLPDLALTWLDDAPERFPDTVPEGVTALPAPDLPGAVALAPQDAHHLILTYSHALDLELCHRLLGHGFASCGLIGSRTKWARFRTRLAALGHSPAQISRIRCPIGDPSLGKHPQAIALGVVIGLVSQQLPKKAAKAAGD